MKRSGFVSIRTRLVILVIVALAPALGLFLADYREHRSHEVYEARTRALEIVRLTATDQQRTIEDARLLVVSLAHLPAFRRADIAACRVLLDDLRPHGQVFGDLGMARADGRWLAGSEPAGGRRDLSGKGWFHRAAAAPDAVVVEYQANGGSGRPGLVVAAAVPANGGRTRLVVYVWRSLPHTGYLYRGVLPEGAALAITDPSGTVLAHDRGPDGSLEVLGVEPRVLRSAVASAGPGTLQAAGRDGIARLWAFAPVTAADTRPAYAFVGIPSSVSFAHVNRTLGRTLGLVALALAAVAFLTWIGSDALLLRRLRGLVRATERLAAGDLSARTGLASGQDELGRLASSFDNMAAVLQHSSERLRQSVDETRALAQRVQTVREEQRAQVAREVDDELAQPMAAARMELAQTAAALRKSGGKTGQVAAERVAAVDHLLMASLRAVQRIGTFLRPPVLDTLGLAAAIEWQAHEFEERTGIPCHIDVDQKGRLPAGNPATALFRILQEALNNVERHARAKQVWVRMARLPGRVELEVRDDGIGIPPEAVEAGGSLGLIEMRERALAFGGEVQVVPADGGGTSVKVVLACPCAEPCPEACAAASRGQD